MIAVQEVRTSTRLGYRPALDALRGVAILLVLWSHYYLPFFPQAGQAGVTLFFVLSGFLITRLMVEEREATGRVDFLAFYGRRALRLLPALVAMLLLIAPVMVLFNEPLSNLLYPLLYVANFPKMDGVELPFVGHTWSLAVEEQFYLVWPAAFVLMLSRMSRAQAAKCCLVAAAAVCCVRPFVYPDAGRIMWALDLRSDALLLGCAVGLSDLDRLPRITRPLFFAAVAALAFASAVNNWHFQPVLGLPLYAGGSAVLVMRALQTTARMPRALTGLGKISYGFYLWHAPLLLVPPLLAFPLTLFFSLASYRYIERPFLRLKNRLRPQPNGGVGPKQLSTLAATNRISPPIANPRQNSSDTASL